MRQVEGPAKAAQLLSGLLQHAPESILIREAAWIISLTSSRYDAVLTPYIRARCR